MGLKGINYADLASSWRKFSGRESDFDAISGCTPEACMLMVNVHPYVNNYIVPSGLTYKEEIAKVAGWIKSRGMKLIIMAAAFDPVNMGGAWTSHERWQVITDPTMRQQWIQTFVEIVQATNPHAVHLFDEPPGGGTYGGLPEFTEEYVFNAFWDFHREMAQALRAVKPTLQIWVQSAPFWDLAPFSTRPLPFNNVVYDFHYFLTDKNCSTNIAAAWQAGDIELAKDIYRKQILNTGRIPETGCRGLGVQTLIDAGLPVQCGSFGSTFFPWIPEWMKYHYELMNEINAGTMQWVLGPQPVPHIPDRHGILDADTGQMNDIGLLWCSLMPMPISPFDLAAALTLGGLTYVTTGNPALSVGAAILGGLLKKKT